MKRIFLVLAVGALMAVMLVAMAAPAFAERRNPVEIYIRACENSNFNAHPFGVNCP